MQAALDQQITFHNNNQVLIKNCCCVATFVSQHVRHIDRHLFQNKLFCAKLQQILLILVENMCLQSQIGNN